MCVWYLVAWAVSSSRFGGVSQSQLHAHSDPGLPQSHLLGQRFGTGTLFVVPCAVAVVMGMDGYE